nr:hypothetical protein [Tanacetum cinerariifolium]
LYSNIPPPQVGSVYGSHMPNLERHLLKRWVCRALVRKSAIYNVGVKEIGDGFDMIVFYVGEDGDVWKISEGSVDGEEVLCVEGMSSKELWSMEGEDGYAWKIGEGTGAGIKVVEGVKDV